MLKMIHRTTGREVSLESQPSLIDKFNRIVVRLTTQQIKELNDKHEKFFRPWRYSGWVTKDHIPVIFKTVNGLDLV